jgi:hypothetical protein
MERGVTDVFQEDLNSMVGGGFDHSNEEMDCPSVDNFDLLYDEDEIDRVMHPNPGEFDESD